MHTIHRLVIYLAIVPVCFAALQGVASAHGILVNGDNAAGAISSAAEIDTCTFDATAGDAISLAIGEVIDNDHFAPWIRLRSPNQTELGSSAGTLAAYINITAALTGTYTVLVA